MRGSAAPVVLAVVALAACGSGGGRAVQTTPFAEDTAQPLAARDAGRVNRGSSRIAVRDVSFATPNGRVRGYLVVPPRARRLPAVVYLTGAGGTRDDFVLPAAWLAARGAVGLTLTPPSSTAGSGNGNAQLELARERDLAVADVVAVRRALDYLRTLPQVDASRLGFVGWSLGARTGAILAGAEPRLRTLVLMSAGASPVPEYVAQAPPDLKDDVRRTLTDVDPLRWVARGRGGTILLQDGRRDTTVPRAALVALAHAAPKGTTLRWYGAGHALDFRAYRDQLAWLTRTLHVTGPRVRGAPTGP